MQAEVVKLALDLLVREPDIEGFFGGLTKTMVEESESYTCAVWLLDEEARAVQPVDGLCRRTGCSRRRKGVMRVRRRRSGVTKISLREHGARTCSATRRAGPRRSSTSSAIRACQQPILEFSQQAGCGSIIATPLLLGSRTLGWMTRWHPGVSEPESHWWRVVLIEAVARQAALALHHSRLVEHNRLEERRKAILEERNRLARDIHDNLAQGFAAILMQLQAAQREGGGAAAERVASSIETAVDLARTHLTEARRSVGALRPNVGNDEDVAAALKRLTDLSQRTTSVPIDLVRRRAAAVRRRRRTRDRGDRPGSADQRRAARTRAPDHDPRVDACSRSACGLSVADDGRGIAREPSTSGFGMTSMQERAERIGASLTIVTAPRNGTEVVLAWDPSSLPTQVHVAT